GGRDAGGPHRHDGTHRLRRAREGAAARDLNRARRRRHAEQPRPARPETHVRPVPRPLPRILPADMQALTTLETRLRRELRGDVKFDRFTRGRYATDASIYQIEPLGVVVPRDADDARRALEIAADAGVPILPRGAG